MLQAFYFFILQENEVTRPVSLTALANSEMCRSKVEAETDPVIYEHRRVMGWLKFRQTHQNIGIPDAVQPQGFVEHEVARADIQPG